MSYQGLFLLVGFMSFQSLKEKLNHVWLLWIMLCWSLMRWFANDFQMWLHHLWNHCESLQWHHNKHNGVSNHRHLHCLLKCLFRCRSKKISKLYVTGLCAGNSPVTSEFPAQKASNADNVSIWWRHHDVITCEIISESAHSWPKIIPSKPYILVYITNSHTHTEKNQSLLLSCKSSLKAGYW